MDAKLDSMDFRIHNLESHLLPPSSPHQATHDPINPKGKCPMGSPLPTSLIPVVSYSSSSSSSSSTSSQTTTQFELAAREPISPSPIIPHSPRDSEATLSPPKQPTPIPSPPKDPTPIPSPPHSPPPPPEPVLPSSPPQTLPPQSISEPVPSPIPPNDSILKPSPPQNQTPPPSPIPQPIPEPTPEPTLTSPPPPAVTSEAIIIHLSSSCPTYQCRKLAVTRPKSSTPLVPFPPPSPTSSS